MNIQEQFGKHWVFEGTLPGEPKEILIGIAVLKKVFQGKSKYQTIEVFDTLGYGRVLCIDGFIQLSSKHEAVYHEMLVHPALCSYMFPERVLIIGGGDGGSLREALRHPVKEVVLVDIDQMVIDVSKKYLPSVSQGSFQNKRAIICIADGAEFVKKYTAYFDCIILDSTDPDGKAARKLFQKKFLQDVKHALKPNGIFAAQTGYFSERFGKRIRKNIQQTFRFFQMHRAFVRCFPVDEHSFSLASSGTNVVNITESMIQKAYEARKLKTSYFSPEMYTASKVFPRRTE